MNTSKKTHPRRKFQIGDRVDHVTLAAANPRYAYMEVIDYISEVKPRVYYGNGGVDFIPGHAAYYITYDKETGGLEFQSTQLKASETVVEDPNEPLDAAWCPAEETAREELQDRKELFASRKFLEESLSEVDKQIGVLQGTRSEIVNTLRIINRNLNEI